jgi:hypothetical protein
MTTPAPELVSVPQPAFHPTVYNLIDILDQEDTMTDLPTS